MLITINAVKQSTHEKGYKIAEVEYTREGKSETKKIMSFAAPQVFTALSNFKVFPVDVNVNVKKEGNFWNWKDIETNTGAQTSGSSTSKPAGKVTGSNYETPEERARRQVYIIRQSSVATAVELAKAQNPKGVEADVNKVIETAKVIEAYVLSTTIPSTDEVI